MEVSHHTLVIAFDGSTGAAGAVRAAAALFPRAPAIVVAAHEASRLAEQAASAAARLGVTPDRYDALGRATEERAEATAAEGAALAQRLGLEAEAQAAGGASLADAILGAAARTGAAAIVCGTRGLGGFSRAVLGSVSTALLHHADRPLLVVPEGAGDASGPLVIGFDGSDASRAAIQSAGRLFAGRPAVVVNVWESPIRHTLAGKALLRSPIDEMRGLTTDLDESFSASAVETAARGAELAEQHGLAAQGPRAVEASSPPWRGLTATAHAVEASVIVAGSRGRGGAASALFGSVSAGLVHNADLPVLIVRG